MTYAQSSKQGSNQQLHSPSVRLSASEGGKNWPHLDAFEERYMLRMGHRTDWSCDQGWREGGERRADKEKRNQKNTE